MLRTDILKVVALEEQTGLSSMGVAGFERELTDPEAMLFVAYAADGHLDKRIVLGSVSGWVVADELQLDNVVVAAGRRQCGTGTALIKHCARAADLLGAVKCVLEVRESNLAACALYRRLGFRIVGRRPRYYHEPVEDALIMSCAGADWEKMVA